MLSVLLALALATPPTPYPTNLCTSQIATSGPLTLYVVPTTAVPHHRLGGAAPANRCAGDHPGPRAPVARVRRGPALSARPWGT